MSNIIKSALISPLLGAVILTVISMIYLIVSNISLNGQELVNFSLGVGKIFPILLCIFIGISYILSIPIGYKIYLDFNKNLRTENFFIKISLIVGFLISLIIALIDYQFHNTIMKSFFIMLGITFMATANASYFMVLSGHINTKSNKN